MKVVCNRVSKLRDPSDDEEEEEEERKVKKAERGRLSPSP